MPVSINDSHWSRLPENLRRTYTFCTFVDAVTFVQQVANLAEIQQHHPDIKIQYTKVSFVLTTHDTQCITEKDIQLAEGIDAIYARFNAPIT